MVLKNQNNCSQKDKRIYLLRGLINISIASSSLKHKNQSESPLVATIKEDSTNPVEGGVSDMASAPEMKNQKENQKYQ